MKLYICSIEGLCDAASYDAASLKIDSHRKENLSRIKSEKDRMRSLCAGVLLNYAVAEYKRELADGAQKRSDSRQLREGQLVYEEKSTYVEEPVLQELSVKELLAVEKQEYEYRREENGKPYLADLSDFHFSLSHSGDYVLCAWDRSDIGADLQCMDREVKDALVKKVMTAKEYSVYASLPKQEQKTNFYKIWSIKESYCKLTGKGLSQNFRDIETDTISFQARLWRENYWLAVSQY